jgi:hypothetical protein
MNEYTVELRIFGKELDPSTITAALELEPTLVRTAGEMKSPTTAWEDGMWAYNGFSQLEGSKVWPSLEEGLTFILMKLSPVREKLEHYKKTFTVMLWCGHFQSKWNSSFTLSPPTLQMLADLGVDLIVDNYSSAENPAETGSNQD